MPVQYSTPGRVEQVQPDYPTARSEARAPGLPHPRTPVFYLTHHPRRWAWSNGEWLPELGRMRLSDGVGGVNQGLEDSDAQTDLARRGWTRLPWDVLPIEGRPYIKSYPCHTGKFHCEYWETPQYIGNTQLDSVIDTEGRTAWLRELIERGHIPRPVPAVLYAICEAKRHAYEETVKDATSPHQIAKAEAMHADLEAAIAAIPVVCGIEVEPQTVEPELPVAPKPKRSRK